VSLLHDEALATRHYRCLVEVTEADDASSALITKAEELLVLDARGELTPAQYVERKLAFLLRGKVVPVSHRRLAQLPRQRADN